MIIYSTSPIKKVVAEVDIEDIDVTPQQALEIAEEVENCKTITSWIHGPSDVMERELGESE